METFTVETQFIFKGKFFIEADTQEEANEGVMKHCGTVLGEINSTLPDQFVDWDFPTHPEKEILTITGRASSTAKTMKEDAWAEDLDYPRKDWIEEVSLGNTQRGYWDWVFAQM